MMTSRDGPPTRLALVIILSCFIPCCISCLIPTLWRLGKELSQRKRDEMPPKVEKRKRKLSMIPPAGGILLRSIIDTKEYEQENCTFFRLPAEVRLMIYEELVTKERIWISSKAGKLICYRGSTIEHLKPAPGPTPLKPGMNAISLLLSCRKIYSEAIDVLYSRPAFAFSDQNVFLCFAGNLLPQRLSSIKRLELHFNEATPPLFLPSKGKKRSSPLLSPFTYYFMHNHLIATSPVRNSCLPPATVEDAIPCWYIICEVIGKMDGLRSVNVQVCNMDVGWTDDGSGTWWRDVFLGPLEWAPRQSAVVVELMDNERSRNRWVSNANSSQRWERTSIDNKFAWSTDSDEHS